MNEYPPFWRLLLVGILLGGWAATAARGDVAVYNIKVACEMTNAGRKLSQPTTDHPAYYTSYLSGFTDWGKPYGIGDPEAIAPPSNEIVSHLVAKVLAEQGYLPALAPAPVNGKARNAVQPAALVAIAQPALIFNIYWGYVADPEIYSHFKVDPDGKVVRFLVPASERMLNLIGTPLTVDSARLGVSQEAGLTRYYVIVDAYDYAAYRKSHQKVLLWRTKMSVPAFNHTLAETIEPMLTGGGPQFGRDITSPINIVQQETPAGRVEVGKPVVVGPDGKSVIQSR